jgi:hypothetical protein
VLCTHFLRATSLDRPSCALDILNPYAGCNSCHALLWVSVPSSSSPLLRASTVCSNGGMPAPLEPTVLTVPDCAKLGSEAKPPNPFPLVTYIAIGSRDCGFCNSRGEMLLWQQLLELQGWKAPTFKKFTYPYGRWTLFGVSKSNIQTGWLKRECF